MRISRVFVDCSLPFEGVLLFDEEDGVAPAVWLSPDDVHTRMHFMRCVCMALLAYSYFHVVVDLGAVG